MLKKICLIVALGVTVSGCFMAPLAFVGPAASGFSSASIIQSGITSGANYMVKKSTGKTITEHAISAINSKNIYQQSYFPTYENSRKEILPKSKPVK
tara:strand:- start:753 stop:1043 length:291 start_codon:yes stop_codon:yes gene_type:complete